MHFLDETLESFNEKELIKRVKASGSVGEKVSKTLMLIYKSIQALFKKESLIKVREACQEFLDRIQHLNSVRPSNRRQTEDFYSSIHELSSIKNSKLVNTSNMTLTQISVFSAEKRQQENLDDQDNDLRLALGQRNVNSFSPEGNREVAPSANIDIERLSPSQKESFNKLVSLFNEVKSSNEGATEKLEQVYSHMERMDMDSVQACQELILKRVWKLMLSVSSETKRVGQFFEQINMLLVKINRICPRTHRQGARKRAQDSLPVPIKRSSIPSDREGSGCRLHDLLSRAVPERWS